jgi:hypothetical protein
LPRAAEPTRGTRAARRSGPAAGSSCASSRPICDSQRSSAQLDLRIGRFRQTLGDRQRFVRRKAGEIVQRRCGQSKTPSCCSPPRSDRRSASGRPVRRGVKGVGIVLGVVGLLAPPPPSGGQRPTGPDAPVRRPPRGRRPAALSQSAYSPSVSRFALAIVERPRSTSTWQPVQAFGVPRSTTLTTDGFAGAVVAAADQPPCTSSPACGEN